MNYSVKSAFIAMLISALFLYMGCKNEPTKPSDTIFTLTVEDVSCTEAWLKLQVGTDISARSVTLTRDTLVLWTRTINDAEIIIEDTSLLPNHTYNYTATINGQGQHCTAQTLDTTSHNFTWQTFTLGDDNGSNYLNDVAIINDTLAYAVGEIYKDSIPYNFAEWNGNNWELKQLFYDNNNIITSIRGIFLFGINDIWFAAGSIFYWDGNSSQAQLVFSRLTLSDPNATIEKLWGISSSMLYGVGNAGTIVFYDGSTWRKIESGTTVNLKDIYGTPDGKEVWTCGWNTSTGEGIILRIKNSGCETLWHSTQSASSPYNGKLLGSLWTDGRKDFWITGSGDVFRHSITSTSMITREAVSLGNYAYRIRGAGRNDITLAGDGAMIWHFNGKTWCKYDNLFNTDNRLYGLAVTSSMAIVVGRAYSTFPTTALIVIGKK